MSEINIILFHKGSQIPSYIKDCIKQIQSTQTNYTLYFLTDIHCEGKDINIINLNNIKISELTNINYYSNERDPLWRTSFERFFYIKEFMQMNNIDNVIHFDNDVLLYRNINDFIDKLKLHIKHIGLPLHKPNEFVCGFMYIKNVLSIQLLCDELYKLAIRGEKELEKELKTMPHEMRLLGHIHQLYPDLITRIPIVPFDEWSDLYNEFNMVFDPSSYGQFFGWSSHKEKNCVHQNDVHRYIDNHIINGNIIPYFDNNTKLPYIKYKDLQIPICNLHIHSKNLSDFIH